MTSSNGRIGVHAAWVALVAMFFSLLVVAFSPGSPASEEPARTDPRPIRAVVLVDESGSLSPEGVAVEKEAAAVIAQSEFSPESQVAVVGFGSTTGRPNQSAVDVVCDMTKVADGPSRDPDQAQLDKFAAGGSQTTCGAGAAAPRARLVRTASDVVPSLLDVFASARCASHSDPQTTQLGSGRTVELTVKVPVITTD